MGGGFSSGVFLADRWSALKDIAPEGLRTRGKLFWELNIYATLDPASVAIVLDDRVVLIVPDFYDTPPPGLPGVILLLAG